MKKSTEHFIKLKEGDMGMIELAIKALKQIEDEKAMVKAKPSIALLEFYVDLYEAGK